MDVIFAFAPSPERALGIAKFMLFAGAALVLHQAALHNASQAFRKLYPVGL